MHVGGAVVSLFVGRRDPSGGASPQRSTRSTALCLKAHVELPAAPRVAQPSLAVRAGRTSCPRTGVAPPCQRADGFTESDQRLYAGVVVRVVRRWFSGSLAALRAALARPELRRVQLAWTGSTSGESISTIALGLYAYEAGGATAVGVVALV